MLYKCQCGIGAHLPWLGHGVSGRMGKRRRREIGERGDRQPAAPTRPGASGEKPRWKEGYQAQPAIEAWPVEQYRQYFSYREAERTFRIDRRTPISRAEMFYDA